MMCALERYAAVRAARPRTERALISRCAYLALIAALLVGAVAQASAARGEPTPSRQEEIAKKGAGVMPFDLARTTHYFDDNASGGVETVTANDPRDREQIALIRAHLTDEAKRFARGDFSDPAKIHGEDMRGLAALEAAHGKLRVTYKSLPRGASVAFVSRDPATVGAIHDWFAAQRSDHAAHAHMRH
jgi:hypothetical protein